MIIDEEDGGLGGYSIANNFMRGIPGPQSSCNAITGAYAAPAVPSSCLRIYSVTVDGAPVTAINQVQYDARNTTWYRQVKSSREPLVFGTTTEPQLNREGVVYAVPVFNATDISITPGLTAVVQVFLQTAQISKYLSSYSNGYANVTYIMDSDNYLIATSETISPSLVNVTTAARLLATNSLNAYIVATSHFLISQSIHRPNVFFMPYSDNSALEISLQTIDYVEGVQVGWKIVSVNLITSSDFMVPTPSPTVQNDSILKTHEDIAIAGIVLGSIGVIAVLVALAWVARSFMFSNHRSSQSVMELSGASNSPFDHKGVTSV